MKQVCLILILCLASFADVLPVSAQAREIDGDKIIAAQLRCFVQNYEAYRALADATRFVVVDFAICPILPDGDDILQAVLAAMGSDMSNSLGNVTFAGEGQSSKFRVFTLDEADCIRQWVYKLTSQNHELVDLEGSFCFDG